MNEYIDIRLSAEPLVIPECIEWVRVPEAGGIDVFIGTVRKATRGREVVQLEFEAYESMALKEMQKIADQVFE
ncbi:MAG TPA: molybdenum cofactor biosynthesis protein MoaE, partial [Flavisolibacter sp.]|nr:molybdenum cofactor biosynthesis protein MoaE [Flavisolibacter sp.]